MSFIQKIMKATTVGVGFLAAFSGMATAQDPLFPLTFHPKRKEMPEPRCVVVGPDSIPTQEGNVVPGSYALIFNEALMLGSYGPYATTVTPGTAGEEVNNVVTNLGVHRDDEGHALVLATSLESDEEIQDALYAIINNIGYVIEGSNITETGSKPVRFCYDNVAFEFIKDTTEALKNLISSFLAPETEATIEEFEQFEDGHTDPNCLKP